MTEEKLPLSEQSKLIKELKSKYEETDYSFDGESEVPYDVTNWSGLAEFIINDRRRIVEKMSQYVEHFDDCLYSQWRQGRPTEDGRYETLFGYGKNEKWYKRGEYTECSCGLDETLRLAGLDKEKLL